MKSLDTIAAIATSSNHGGISVIRISGEDALPIIDQIYQAKNKKKKLSDMNTHTIHYGYICDGDTIIDEVMVLIMRGPSSYTREDVIEIDCHGGAYVAKTILDLVIRTGARVAEPGEFTKRAFLNGRIDLSQAEAVADIINAKNKYALQSSINTLRGDVKEAIAALRDKILHDIAFIEAALDDPEHISLDGFTDTLFKQCGEYLNICNHILDNCENGRIMMEGVRTIILGKPNVGKSSLMNRLLGSNRAIVTNVPGTTRDTLEEEIRIGEVTLRIIDTAGIRHTDDIVEKIGIQKAKDSLKEADFVITILDSSSPFDENDREVIECSKEYPGVILLNKSDLDAAVTKSDLSTKTDKSIIEISAKSGDGMDELENLIKEMFYREDISFNDEIFIHNARQKEALQNAISSLRKVEDSIEMGMSEDFFSIDLTDAYESLGKILGETIEDDIIDTIFREFCMGK